MKTEKPFDKHAASENCSCKRGHSFTSEKKKNRICFSKQAGQQLRISVNGFFFFRVATLKIAHLLIALRVLASKIASLRNDSDHKQRLDAVLLLFLGINSQFSTFCS